VSAHAALLRGSPRGFTLLEVLVAIAILGLGLTMILSSQVGLFSGATRAQNLAIVTNLARCKMSEVEVELLKTGYPEFDQTGEGACCGDEEQAGYQCAWKVERIELPDESELQADGGLGSEDGGMLGALSAIQNMPQVGANGEVPSLSSLADDVGLGAAAGGIGPMVMGMVYPTLKPMLEASIRKVTIKVGWKEGINEREFLLTQYVTSPQQGNLNADGGGIPGLPPGLLDQVQGAQP
jgi:general secretion pathway protein I